MHIDNPHSLGVGLRTSARRFGVFFLCGWAFLSEVSADTLVIRFPSYYGTSLFEQDGTTALSAGSLVRVGSFNITDTALVSTPGLTSAEVVTAGGRFSEYTNFNLTAGQLAGTEFFPRLAGEDEDGNEIFDPSSLPSMDSLQGKKMYLIFYNAATAAAATELAIFRYLTPTDLIIGSQGVFPTAGNPAASNERDTSFQMNPLNLSLLIGQNVNGQLRLGSISNGIGQITSPLTDTSTVGSPDSYQILANNGADRFFATTNTSGMVLTETNLPTGFSIATNTGVITAGTNAAANTYSIRLVASNSLTASVATNTLIWTLQASSLSFTTTTNLISAVAGVAISPFTFVSTGTSPTYTADGNLRGLTLSTNGILSGIPNSVGTNDVSIQASAGGQSASTTFSLAVAAPTISVPADQLSGGQLVATSGIARTIVLSNTAGFTNLSALSSPERTGVSFNGTNLIIATNALPLAKGTTNVTLTLTASRAVGGSTVSASTTVPLRILAPAPTALIGTNEFEVDVGQAFSATVLTDAGSLAQMAFSNLPSGLTDFVNGNISGTNNSSTLPFEFPVTVRADSSALYEGGGVFTSTITLRLRNTNAPYFASATNRHYPGVGRAISPITLVASNFPFQHTASNLPAGLQLVGAIISGTPTTAGRFEVPVVAYNAYRPGSTNPADWQTGTGTLIFHVAAARPPTSLAPTAPGTITRNTTLSTSDNVYLIPGGADNAGVRVAAYGLPPGLSLDPTTGKLFGTTGGPGSYTATVFIQNGRGWIKRNVTLTVQ